METAMNKPPAFQFYADDFLAGTFAMTNEERGLYITLLCRQWTQGHVTADEMARLSHGMAQPMASHVFAKFQEHENGTFKNERMELERAKQAAFRINRSESGKVGANKRWHSHSTAITQPMANGMAKHSSPSPSPITHTHTPDAVFPTWEEVRAKADISGIPEASAKTFYEHHEGNQLWINQHGRLINWMVKMKSWSERDRTMPKKTGIQKPYKRDWSKPNIADSL